MGEIMMGDSTLVVMVVSAVLFGFGAVSIYFCRDPKIIVEADYRKRSK